MVRLRRFRVGGDFPILNVVQINHNGGMDPDKIFVWDDRFRPIKPDRFVVTFDNSNQATLTFNDNMKFRGRWEAEFSELVINEGPTPYRVMVVSGMLSLLEVPPLPPLPELPDPPKLV